MGIFSKKMGPVFVKEDSDAKTFIDKMEELHKQADSKNAKKIDSQIKMAKYGKQGEDNIAFELKNSGMDMCILHDIYLENGELSAQIDYIVITRQYTFVIECKNLIGNIEIDHSGAFIRTYEMFGKYIKEGIYSPITQNQRHLQIIKEARKESRTNVLSKFLFDKYFNDNYQSVVVLANPKTYLNAKYAPKQIKEQVIRADQLITHMKQKNAMLNDKNMSNDEMLELAKFFLEKNKSERSDYVKKYEEIISTFDNKSTEDSKDKENEMIRKENIQKQDGQDRPDKSNNKQKQEIKQVEKQNTSGLRNTDENKEKVILRLKEYRLNRSRSEKIKPYYLFNDAQMNELIEKAPQSKEELLQVSGFGTVKAEKYGAEIIRILQDGNI